MKKRFLPLSMVLITIMLAQAGLISNAAETQGKYVPRTNTDATVSSYLKSIRANQETGLIDPALMLQAQKAAQTTTRGTGEWTVMGPDNYGALTKAMIYDQNDATGNTLLIGTMGGHIFESVNGGITMRQAYDLNTMINCMVQLDGVTFVGTGDPIQNWDNGMSQMGYNTGFIGDGVYRIGKDGSLTHLESTTATATNGWAFVNEMAVIGNTIYAATVGGLYKSTDMGDTWTMVKAGYATSVKTNSKYVLAVIGDEDWNNVSVYRINEDGTQTSLMGGNALPETDALKIVALSQSDPEYIYASYINWTLKVDVYTYSTGNIYYSKDGGATWQLALAASSMYDIYDKWGYQDKAIEVFPNNPRRVLVGGVSVWTLEDATNTGVYRPIKVSSTGNELATTPDYVHNGVQNFLFHPNNPNVFFVGTEGGVSRGLYAESVFTFARCDRYFIQNEGMAEPKHTSVARMFGVGVGGRDNRVLGGCLDHGTILIQGDENINNVETGRAIFPNCDPTSNAAVVDGYGVYTHDYAGGHAEISTFDPNIMFVSATGNLSTPLYRTETSGADYDIENFYNADSTFSKVITNANSFRTPFAMYENYCDVYSTRTVSYITPIDLKKDTIIDVFSGISKYPFKYQVTENHVATDTIEDIYDPISATLVCGVEGAVYMTRNSHYFNEMSKWWKIGTIDGIPSAVAFSSNGDMTIVGTKDGKLYRMSNLTPAVTPELACIDSTACIINFELLDSTLFGGRAITGISIVGSKVLVSLGNYGNNDYVYLSTDNGDNFTSIQGNLPKAPVYSCLIESSKGTGDIFVGTEYGIYSKRSNGNWTAEGSVKVPVTELRQAIVMNHDDIRVLIGYDNNDVTKPLYEYFEGVKNEGAIYASTYGNGIIRCNDYRLNGSDLGIDENEVEANASLQMNVYPNPVRGTANVSFELTESATVSYHVYDLSGRMVMSNVLGTYGQGENTVSFSTGDLTSGSYILRVQAGNKTCTSKIMVF